MHGIYVCVLHSFVDHMLHHLCIHICMCFTFMHGIFVDHRPLPGFSGESQPVLKASRCDDVAVGGAPAALWSSSAALGL